MAKYKLFQTSVMPKWKKEVFAKSLKFFYGLTLVKVGWLNPKQNDLINVLVWDG